MLLFIVVLSVIHITSQIPTCNSSQIQCDGGRCLDKIHVCDDTVNCKDKTDEINCSDAVSCPKGSLPCSDGLCLTEELWCDGVKHCSDGSDERCDFNVSRCNNDEFSCGKNGKCIPTSWKCDGKADCDSDESSCNVDDFTDVTGEGCEDGNLLWCAQKCSDNRCTCKPGYELLHSDNRTCDSVTPPLMYLLINSSVYVNSAENSELQLLYKHTGAQITAFDVNSGILIFSTNEELYRKNLGEETDADASLLFRRRNADITSLFVDWSTTGNIYWTESSGTLRMTNSGPGAIRGIKTLLHNVKDVQIDPAYYRLYYLSTLGPVYKCYLDGTNCDELTLDDEQMYTYIYLDPVNRNLYIGTTTEIKVYTESGSKYTVLPDISKNTFIPLISQVIYFGSKLYMLTKEGTLMYYQRIHKNTVTTPHNNIGMMRLEHETLKSPYSAPCPTNCQHFCLFYSSEVARCSCADHFTDSGDGTCQFSGETCADELRCSDRMCLTNVTQICDSYTDCYDDSDEMSCNVTCDTETQHKCNIGGCIPRNLLCDTRYDCSDGSDEQGCEECSTGFLCGTGRCIPDILKCNTHDDCGDNSDESTDFCGYTPCPPSLFECSPNNCIPQSWRCNGFKDCDNATDEVDCSADNCVFKCDFKEDEQRCLPASAICNDIVDCDDRSDEQNCQKDYECQADQFRCKDLSGCLSILFRCDGEAQCVDGSDEANCDTCNTTDIKCDNGLCLNVRYKCDGVAHCPRGEDELDCCLDANSIQCDGVCHPPTILCNGAVDCTDGSDESYCDFNDKCRADEFRCTKTGSCIKRHYVCDGRIDCKDMSDEIAGCDAHSNCNSSSYRCDNGRCVTHSDTCNGIDDCGDSSDEARCGIAPVNECERVPCDLTHSTCVDVRLGYYCKCDVGYTLHTAKHMCIDIDECLVGSSGVGSRTTTSRVITSAVCSQHCINVPGSYVCTCNPGFYLDHTDKSTCIPESVADLILVTHHDILKYTNILKSHLISSLSPLLPEFNTTQHIHGFVQVKMTGSEYTDNYIATGTTLYKHTTAPQTHSYPEIVTSDVHISSLAINTVTDTLYYTDPVYNLVKLLSGTGSVTIVTNVQLPSNLQLVPDFGKMYFIHVVDNVAGVSSCGLDGKGLYRLTHSSQHVSHFHVDPYTHLLYYLDTACGIAGNDDATSLCIGRMKLTGDDKKILFKRSTTGVSAMTVFAAHIFLAHSGGYVTHCKLYSDYSCTDMYVGVVSVSFLSVSAPGLKQGSSNPCSPDPCTADQVCVLIAAETQTTDTQTTDTQTELQSTCVCKEEGFSYDGKKSCIADSNMCDKELYFPCANGKGCVELQYRCDTISDCSDASDELQCNNACHSVLQFSCHTKNQCIPVERRCDGVKDCFDNSDEKYCVEESLCDSTIELFCPATKTCIPLAWKCDGTVDCLHDTQKSDEQNCNFTGCPASAPFGCANNAGHLQCFPDIIVSDGKVDCKYQTDEDDRSCDQGTSTCSSSALCYPDNWWCDGQVDCVDHSDEDECRAPTCTDGYKLVYGTRCVSLDFWCDGWVDLHDMLDEKYCNETVKCDLEHITCGPRDVTALSDNVKQCLPRSWLCDYQYCFSDNSSCDCLNPRYRSCGKGNQCIETTYWCDGSVDCDNGLDEESCPVPKCGVNDFKCGSTSVCLRNKIGVCDGADDCHDMSDEADCPLGTYFTCPQHLYDCKTGQKEELRCVDLAKKTATCFNKRNIARADTSNLCKSGNGGCAHLCTHNSADNTRSCSCHHGYKLLPDKRSCKDVDECLETPNVCSQRCTNVKGSYFCSCIEGFIKTGDGSGCKAKELGSPAVLISTGFDMRISSFTKFTKISGSSANRKRSVDASTKNSKQEHLFGFFSPHSKLYYYINKQTTGDNSAGHYILNSVENRRDDVEEKPTTVALLDGVVLELQYDYISHSVIYNNAHSLIVLSLFSNLSTAIFTDINTPVTAFALAPSDGLVFYVRDGMLGVMRSEGSDAHFLTKYNLEYRLYQLKGGSTLTALTVDESAQRLYWYNSYLQQITSANYQGGLLTTVASNMKHVGQMRVYGDFLFILTDRELKYTDKRRLLVKDLHPNLPKPGYITLVQTADEVKCTSCQAGICFPVRESLPISGSVLQTKCVKCDNRTITTGDNCKIHCFCLNNGKCELGQCKCPETYFGSRCELRRCSPDNMCQNKADCEDRGGGVVCHCKPGTKGKMCEETDKIRIKGKSYNAFQLAAMIVIPIIILIFLVCVIYWKKKSLPQVFKIKQLLGLPQMRYERQIDNDSLLNSCQFEVYELEVDISALPNGDYHPLIDEVEQSHI